MNRCDHGGLLATFQVDWMFFLWRSEGAPKTWCFHGVNHRWFGGRRHLQKLSFRLMICQVMIFLVGFGWCSCVSVDRYFGGVPYMRGRLTSHENCFIYLSILVFGQIPFVGLVLLIYCTQSLQRFWVLSKRLCFVLFRCSSSHLCWTSTSIYWEKQSIPHGF